MQTTLYYRQGSSDKVYTVSIVPQSSLRRQHRIRPQRLHPADGHQNRRSRCPGRCSDHFPEDGEGKDHQGYIEGEAGTRYTETGSVRKNTDILPQLLNPITEEHAQKYIEDPAYWMQEKLDGRRILLKKTANQVTGINRLGLETELPLTIVKSAMELPGDFLVDGEAVGDTLHVFDLLELANGNLRDQPYGQRMLKAIQLLAGSIYNMHLKHVPTATLTDNKRSVFAVMKARGKEGVVFKHEDSTYIPGRPASGGSQLKCKFYETASFIVGKIHPNKRSISLLLFEGDRIKPAGNVTIPVNHDIPKPGDVVECRYLYAFKESGSIFQPVYLGRRDDIRAAECVVGQLKYKMH
ncbi:hypothetical protein [Verrucomicrobium spinosum]|uniref:hypothetical protein n=1 Tax=Verrucomicrobium spinosum TaxID=2736 RepID=UPI0009E70D1E|nr:hypothetical protein [Verrucomicrobium spinosum]